VIFVAFCADSGFRGTAETFAQKITKVTVTKGRNGKAAWSLLSRRGRRNPAAGIPASRSDLRVLRDLLCGFRDLCDLLCEFRYRRLKTSWAVMLVIVTRATKTRDAVQAIWIW
jgi:hypothetical protein